MTYDAISNDIMTYYAMTMTSRFDLAICNIFFSQNEDLKDGSLPSSNVFQLLRVHDPANKVFRLQDEPLLCRSQVC